jgi:hypothetical protein
VTESSCAIVELSLLDGALLAQATGGLSPSAPPPRLDAAGTIEFLLDDLGQLPELALLERDMTSLARLTLLALRAQRLGFDEASFSAGSTRSAAPTSAPAPRRSATRTALRAEDREPSVPRHEGPLGRARAVPPHRASCGLG